MSVNSTRRRLGEATRADDRPLLFAVAAAALGVLVWVLAVRGGWLGPDVGRGSDFCEGRRPGRVLQPTNTASNLAFVVAGLAIAWHARRAPRRSLILRNRVLTAFLAVLVVLLGPGSAAMHATQSALGGHLDLMSMFLVSAFAVAYAVTRYVRGATVAFVRVFLVALLAQEILDLHGGPIPVLVMTGNLGFAATLVTAGAFEIGLARRGEGIGRRWALAGLGCFAVAFVIWNLTKNGSALCHPYSWFQGHAVWHILTAATAYCIYRAYASPQATMSQD